jgi:flavin-dependent dehydrogenase
MRRRLLDERVLTAALDAGAVLREHTTVASLCWDDKGTRRVSGVRLADGAVLCAPFVALACGAGTALASSVGATRDRNMLQGVAIRAYAPSSSHADAWLEASITLAAPGELPGYGWVFPLGDGSVNIGYGTLTRGRKSVNLRSELARYHARVASRWGLDQFVNDWAWRLPMHVQHRSGAGWVVLGDAAGLVNPCNGEGIDYALESGRFAAESFCTSRDPLSAAEAYELRLVQELDWFLSAARRFAGSLHSPRMLDALLTVSMSSQWTMSLTAATLGNVLSADGRGCLERTVRATDRVLRLVCRA